MNNCKRKVIIFSVFLMTFSNLKAQEMLGLVSSDYSGIHGALINPASLTNSRYYLDINFLTLGLSAENNYVYLKKDEYKNFLKFLRDYNKFPTHTLPVLTVNHYENHKLVNGFINERLMGPSAMLNIGKQAFGITTSFRTVASVKNVPYEFATLLYEGLNDTGQFGPPHPIRKKYAYAGMGWAELGLSYAYVFKQSRHEYWSGGITIKRLMGYSGTYAYINNINYSVIDRNHGTINSLNAEAGYSLPIDYGTNAFLSTPLFRGGGFGFDIGIMYQKMKQEHQKTSYRSICSEPYKPYLYRIGVSIIDLGSISFKKNAQQLVFIDAKSDKIDFRKFIQTNMDSVIRDISQHFFNNPDVLPQGNRIKIGLPTALSMQMDINYTGNWYVNGMFIYPLLLSKASIARPAQLAITPRYETDHFEIDMPISMYDFIRPRIGLSVRLGFLTIGTDKLGGFFSLNNFTGMDFYMALKWSFLKGHCPHVRKKNTGSCVGFN